MSLEVSLTSRTQLPPGSIKHVPPPPVVGGIIAGLTSATATPAAVYTPGRTPSNAGAYFRPAAVSAAGLPTRELEQLQAQETLPS